MAPASGRLDDRGLQNWRLWAKARTHSRAMTAVRTGGLPFAGRARSIPQGANLAPGRRDMRYGIVGALVLVSIAAVAGPAGAQDWDRLPPGTWMSSCEEPEIHGGVLTAFCRREFGTHRHSSIDLRDCNGGPVSN